MDWSAGQYLRFEDERTRPARDLLNAVRNLSPGRAVDLGCGPGNSTELLVERYPEAAVEGIDSSTDMIEKARERLPGLRFEVADISAWEPEDRYDVIFSNAVMHWLPGHARLFPRLAACLKPGGSLAIQMPDNMDEPSHRAMREVAALPEFAGKLAGAGEERSGIASPSAYYSMLQPCCGRIDIWRTVYNHALAGPEAIVEWFKGSGLRPYLTRLNQSDRALFLDTYLETVRQGYPPMPDGRVLLAFPRLFLVAERPGQ
ncbi:MAG: trans-aconitate 2-methyltransferase [Hyphomicrobiales bacterium]